MRRDKKERKYANSFCGVEKSLWQKTEAHINKVREEGVNPIKFESVREASHHLTLTSNCEKFMSSVYGKAKIRGRGKCKCG